MDAGDHQNVSIDEGKIPCTVRGCTLPVDLVLVSDDGKDLGTHKFNLGQYSDGFPPFIADDAHEIRMQGGTMGCGTVEKVPLPKRAEPLQLLLQYMHHTRQPDLEDVDFIVLAELAEAAEKYGVYAAMTICHLFMARNVDTHPVEVFLYAKKHGYIKLADVAAPLTLKQSAAQMYSHATKSGAMETFLKWVLYREQFINASKAIYRMPPVVLHTLGVTECSLWAAFQRDVLIQAGLESAVCILRFGEIVEQALSKTLGYNTTFSDCRHCKIRRDGWVRSVKDSFIEPKFSSIGL